MVRHATCTSQVVSAYCASQLVSHRPRKLRPHAVPRNLYLASCVLYGEPRNLRPQPSPHAVGKNADLDNLLNDISGALPKCDRPVPSDVAKAAIDDIRCRKIVNMAPFRGGTVKAMLTNFIADVWAVLYNLHADKTDYVIHMSYFVQTMAVTWQSDGRHVFNKFKTYSRPIPFYFGIVEQALKHKAKIPRFSIASLGQYNTFHGLLVKLDGMNKQELIPGAIGHLGVGGFYKESMDDQIQVLMGVKGKITREAVKEAYESYRRAGTDGHDSVAHERGAVLLLELGLGDCGPDAFAGKVREYKDAMFAYEQRLNDDEDTGYSDWVSALDRPSASLAKLGVLFNVVDLPTATFEDIKSRICTMLKDAGDKHKAERADTISSAIANLGLVDAELVKSDEDLEQYEGMFD